MPNSPDLKFQTAIYSELVDALPGKTVLSHPTPGQALPYVFIGESEVSDDSPLGHMVRIDVHTWSKLEGPHEVKEIQHSIREALHAISLTQDDWRFSCIREDFAKAFVDADGESWHGVQRFRAYAGLI